MQVDVPSPFPTRLSGLFRPEFKRTGRIAIDVNAQTSYPETYPWEQSPEIRIYDAREIQSDAMSSGQSEAAFFQEHGYILLKHESKVQNWDSGASGQNDRLKLERNPQLHKSDVNEIKEIYAAEIDAVIRNQLLPGKNLVIECQDQILRRGPKSVNPFFGATVHNDYGLTATDYEENMVAFGAGQYGRDWRQYWERPEVEGAYMINFWRTAYMDGPLRHMPLAVCDPTSVEIDDVLPSSLLNFAPTEVPTRQLSLRYNESQKWVYYPEMEPNEALVLTLFRCFKDEAENPFKCTYHSAFDLHLQNVEPRESTEYRVMVFQLRD